LRETLLLAGDPAGKNTNSARLTTPITPTFMPHSPENPAPNTTVLIAEDDPVFRRVLVAAVAQLGVQIETVGNGNEAYERIHRGGVDFLVLDHQMPLCSGIELLERMVSETSNEVRMPPTVLCTAKGFEIDGPALSKRFNLVGILHKPFSATQLGQLISQNLR
jgi:CheY-like chemotaxis protein